MPKPDKCGVYRACCLPTGKIYVGSSVKIEARWSGHKKLLQKGRHTSRHFQHAWDKYGHEAFSFEIIEECLRDKLLEREQYWIDNLKPELNITTKAGRPDDALVARMVAGVRARAASITHCPRGHLYDDANTYINNKGKRICRACNALRVAAIIAAETPEQRNERNRRNAERYLANYDKYSSKQLEYAIAHREEKREYDRARRDQANLRRRQRHAEETTEKRELRLMQKRESYHRTKSKEARP